MRRSIPPSWLSSKYEMSIRLDYFIMKAANGGTDSQARSKDNMLFLSEQHGVCCGSLQVSGSHHLPGAANPVQQHNNPVVSLHIHHCVVWISHQTAGTDHNRPACPPSRSYLPPQSAEGGTHLWTQLLPSGRKHPHIHCCHYRW